MTTYSHAPTPARRSRWFALVACVAALAFAVNVPAQAPAAPGGVAMVPSAEALDKLVGRIALYPDDLVAVILPASTFPLEIVQADRFLEKRKADPKLPLDDKWDDSVKTLLNYPEVVKSMSSDLDWTSDLGEAVVADQGAVLEAVQVFRRKTQAAGNLKSDDKQTVVVEKEVITIAPANPQVVYVPQYNPTTVVVSGGYPTYGYYPAPYPSYYYPYAPGAAFATGLLWGAAIGAAWTGGRYGANYGGGNNNINIDRSNNINVNRSGSGSGAQPRSGGSGQASQWKSNKQPGQVSSGRGQTGRVGDSGSRGGAGGGGGFGGSTGGARPSTQPGGGASNRGGGGAFDGGGASGRQTNMDSSRGASSRASSPSARQSSAGGGFGGGGGARSSGGGGGGARAGGGGGGARGGGGGRGGGGRR